jgi:site-specific recombinase XerD
MSHVIRVIMPIAYDETIVTSVIGDRLLPVKSADRVLAPFITINGRIHTTTSDFLRSHCMSSPNLTSARRMANDLASWMTFLCNDCNLTPFEDSRDPALMATEDQFGRYYRKRQYGTPDEVMSSDGWAHAISVIKRFYEFCARRYQHKPPFEITRFHHHQWGKGTTIAGYKPRRRNTGSAGVPLTPEFADLLLMGALRLTKDGHQADYRAADRDHAIISLALGTGLRRNNLAHMTVYEVPAPSEISLTTMRVADRITKGDAGGDAIVFTHRLPAVHNYLEGARNEVARRSKYKPSNPLRIITANAKEVRFRDQSGLERTRLWLHLSETERRQLVTENDQSPVLFLNENSGKPLAYSSYQHVVDGSAEFVREHINKSFPHPFRLHDLRHTYAVHLTIAFYRDVMADIVATKKRDDWVVDHLHQSVELVSHSLGHASESSTRLYVQTAHRFLAIPLEQFLGRN